MDIPESQLKMIYTDSDTNKHTNENLICKHAQKNRYTHKNPSPQKKKNTKKIIAQTTKNILTN